MSRPVGTTDISQQEFYSIRRVLKTGEYQYVVAERFGRSQGVISRIANAKTWTEFRHRGQSVSKPHMLDTNLTAKQATAFLEMQTQLETVKADRDLYKERTERYESLNKTQGETIARY